ncbi:MAG TPA: hypothetical protein VFZ83_03835 [Acidimicrobiia bacterium]|nr:hypothetical protein [Acidimicrobiia bacterium]
MERRIAITTAATVALTVLAGGTAIAANVGIIGDQPASGLGETPSVTVASTDDQQPEVRTIVVDETVPAPPSSATTPDVTAPSPSGDDSQGDDAHGDDESEYDDDSQYDDESDDHDDDESDDVDDDETEDEHEDEHEDEFEGADDDD